MYRLITPSNILNAKDWTLRYFTLDSGSEETRNKSPISALIIFFRTKPSLPRLSNKYEFEAHPD